MKISNIVVILPKLSTNCYDEVIAMSKFIKILCLVGLISFATQARAQRIALKTNALEWICLSPNAGLEARLTKHLSLNIEGAGSFAKWSDKKLHYFTLRPELRYWFSGRMQTRHFMGIMPIGTGYDIKLNSTRHKGWGLGLGLTYGYSLVISKHFSIEGTVGAGVLNYEEKKFNKTENGEKVHHKFGVFPLKLAVSAVYVF